MSKKLKKEWNADDAERTDERGLKIREGMERG